MKLLLESWRKFIKEEYFIRATEMTSEEIAMYFRSIGIKDELINTWTQANKMANMAKYAGQIPIINQFHKDKEDFRSIDLLPEEIEIARILGDKSVFVRKKLDIGVQYALNRRIRFVKDAKKR
mgnify:CR=1 FL=1